MAYASEIYKLKVKLNEDLKNVSSTEDAESLRNVFENTRDTAYKELREKNEKVIPYATIAEIRHKVIVEKSLNSAGLIKSEKEKLDSLNQCEMKQYL